MKKGKYLITGCAGFVGSNLVKKISKDYDLILVDDLSRGFSKNLEKKLRKKLIKKRIQDVNENKFKSIKGVFHLAAQSSVPVSIKKFKKSSINNISSSLKVFDLAKKFSVPVVYASSSAVYGNLPVGKDYLEKYSIASPYALDKLTMENYAKMCHEIFNVTSVGLRLFNIYGPGQDPNNPYSAVIPKFIKRMKKNIPVIINGGYQTRDFIFIDDVIKILTLSMKKAQSKNCCKVLNVGTGRSISINYLYKVMKNELRSKSKFKKNILEKFDPKKSSCSVKKLYSFLNLKKSFFTKLENGVKNL